MQIHQAHIAIPLLQVTKTCAGWSFASKSSDITTGWNTLWRKEPKMCSDCWVPARSRIKRLSPRYERTHCVWSRPSHLSVTLEAGIPLLWTVWSRPKCSPRRPSLVSARRPSAWTCSGTLWTSVWPSCPRTIPKPASLKRSWCWLLLLHSALATAPPTCTTSTAPWTSHRHSQVALGGFAKNTEGLDCSAHSLTHPLPSLYQANW